MVTEGNLNYANNQHKKLVLINENIMAFSANFTASQVLGSGAIIVLSDVGTGSDVNITQRRAYFAQASGAFLVPSGTTTNYVQWALSSNPINVNILTTDMALLITCQWLDVNNTVLYTESQLYCFTNYGESFMYSLTQNQAAQPTLLLDINYLDNKYKVRVYIDAANNSVLFGGDISSSQNCIDAYTYLIQNQSFFF